MSYRNKRVLVTGGLGFIGSNLALRLAALGARVTVVDSAIPGCGANPYNIQPAADRIQLLSQDLSDAPRFREAIRDSEIVFNLAGEISHIHSVDFPERDLQINTVAQLRFLRVCAEAAPGVRIVYAATRQVYGTPSYLPVDESHPIQPVDFNGVHKYAAAMYHLMLSQDGRLDAAVLNLTNVYGPRMALDVPCQGFLSTFLRRLLLGAPLEVFGDGNQLRDPLYVDDALEAFLLAGLRKPLPARTFNVGGPETLSIRRIAEIAREVVGEAPEIAYRPFPAERRAIDIGSYSTDSGRIREALGWTPRVGFAEGLERTLAYYRQELTHYLDPTRPMPACRMPEHGGARRRLALVPLQ